MPGLRASHGSSNPIESPRSRRILSALPGPESDKDDLWTRNLADGGILAEGKDLLRKRRALWRAALFIGRNLPTGLDRDIHGHQEESVTEKKSPDAFTAMIHAGQRPDPLFGAD